MWQQCLLCETTTDDLLCACCHGEIRGAIHSRHENLRKIPGTDVPLLSFAAYCGKFRRLVQIAKAQRFEQSALALPYTHLAAQRLAERLLRFRCDLVVPLPERRWGLDARRKVGHDLAYLLGSHLQIPIDTTLLKTKHPWRQYFEKPQKERTRAERLSFAPELVARVTNIGAKLHHVVIVDDVCTTGASLRAAVKSLQDAGLRVSAAVTLADTPSYG